MKKSFVWRLIGGILLTCLAFFYTQIVAAGMESRVLEPQVSDIKTGSDMMDNYDYIRTLSLPEFSGDEEEEILRLIGDETRFHISISRTVEVGEENWGQVGQKDGFAIWQLHIHSPQAFGIQVNFHEFFLAEGMSVKVYGGGENGFEMPYISQHHKPGPDGPQRFSSLLIPNDTIVVETWIPLSASMTPATFPFKIESIYHQFRDGRDNVKGVSPLLIPHSHSNCPIENRACDFPGVELQPWASVGRMVSGAGQCSGNLINSQADDDSYLFLTAYHCIDRLVGPETRRGANVNVSFEFGVSDCNRGGSATASGARFVAANQQGDYALLSIPISNLVFNNMRVVLMGWDPNVRPEGSFLDIFHHSRGQTQNFASSEITGFSLFDGSGGFFLLVAGLIVRTILSTQ